MSLNSFLNQLSGLSGNDFSGKITNLLSIDLNNQQTAQTIAVLQDELQRQKLSDNDILSAVESRNFFNDDWSGFKALVTSYLKLARDLDPSSLLRSNDLLLFYLNDLSATFLNNQYGANMVVLLYESLNFMIPILKRVDLILNNEPGKKFKRLTYLSTILTRLFNHLRSVKQPSNPKKKLILFVVNQLNKTYFRINSPLLCANIFANVTLISKLKLSDYPKSQQVEYRYILGRYYLIKNQLIKSFIHLNWSYVHSLPRSSNTLKILKYLIPVGLLVGKIPSRSIISQIAEFNQIYTPLIHHLLKGNHYEYQLHLYKNQQYFASKSLLLLLAQQGRPIIFRNLIYNLFNHLQQSSRFTYEQLRIVILRSIGYHRSNNIENETFKDQHSFKLLILTNNSINDSRLQDQVLENICVSLINNDLMKGSLAVKNKMLLISRKDPFPDVYNSLLQHYGLSSSENWMNK